ncbi:glycoside hydrolase family 15 protein [Sinomicrobium soli]|uniref:glycoside hydrolase family 15 protein n=1 Tax=Sinomicrobium sp. N-1-3-6 TaxID=2219864 RepID=UPI000DCBF1E4|nr:glycoside hydrolase family 15 protein [Sinomicrobium sp. N-1-3-6]RAV28560.1 glycoside hydrolase family 15 protein [Sinomicrobium sp. N-1-3-6]
MDNLDYGIIGNCKSAALISKTGSLDWCCLPEFDSSSVFARLLDRNQGGNFEFLVADDCQTSQRYIPNTNILVTRFMQGDHIFEVCDFMPRYKTENGSYYVPSDIVRYIRHVSGTPEIRVKYNPKLEYAVGNTSTKIKPDYIVSVTENGKYDSLYLYSSLDKKKILDGELVRLEKDEFFLLSYNEKIYRQTTERAYLDLERTKVYWLNWADRTPAFRKYQEQIMRSALTLKLLSYDRTGAVLAAITTSLPETIGEVRNWDYRFCWIRDASMVIKVVSALGHFSVARRYLRFIIDLIPDKDEKLQIMYGINKEKMLEEKTLDHLEGYEGSRPVRVGNAAYEQRQNDIYGILMDVIHQQIVKFETALDNCEELWTITKGVVWVVGEHWAEPDKGIWEFRTEERHFTFSKVLCWVAIDRAIKVAHILGKNNHVKKWMSLEREIRQDIMDKAWNEKVQAFTQAYDSEDLDAAVLLMEPYGFIRASDPKYVMTVKGIERELCNDGLLYRYKNRDDFGLPSSSFTICTFWFINSLYKIGEQKKAIRMFDKLLSYSNHLGLFSEDIDFKTKRLLGNFPQAYSHLALIETAINLSNGLTDEEEIRAQVS